MANENQRPDETPGDGVPEGSEDQSSGPAPHSEELTVEDILSAEQAAAAQAQEETHRVSSPGPRGPQPAAGDPELDGPEPEDETERSYLDDLRRLTAEYANYRKRTEANALLEKQRATAAAVTPLLSVLDDLDRAEQHGDLEEGSAIATIAQKIRGTLERMGVEGFGETGEAFDPQVHEAIAQVPVPGTEHPTVLDVVERGYRIGDVELRPAKVAVAVAADG